MTVKLRELTERQRAVVATMRMRLTEVEAMKYLADAGHPMSPSTWARIKAFLKRTALERLHHIAMRGFEEQHITRIETCEMIETKMWENYEAERYPFRKVMILKAIQELQPLISSYYDATRLVLEKQKGLRDEQQQLSKETDSISEPTS